MMESFQTLRDHQALLVVYYLRLLTLLSNNHGVDPDAESLVSDMPNTTAGEWLTDNPKTYSSENIAEMLKADLNDKVVFTISSNGEMNDNYSGSEGYPVPVRMKWTHLQDSSTINRTRLTPTTLCAHQIAAFPRCIRYRYRSAKSKDTLMKI